MAFSGISSKIMVLARELIHLHGEEINFRNPVELEVPPSNWPDPSTCSIASTCEEWSGNDYGRISIQSHRDTFSLEVTQSIQRLERIAELEGISIVKCRANQILDKTLQSFNLSDGNVISTGKNNISEKCRRILVEGAKQQNPELFRKPDETIAIEMVTDVDSNGHIESTVILPVPVNISLVQMLDRLEARFNETVGKRPMQRGLWKYATQTGEVIGLLSDAKLKHTMKLFKHSKATPIFWRVSLLLQGLKIRVWPSNSLGAERYLQSSIGTNCP